MLPFDGPRPASTYRNNGGQCFDTVRKRVCFVAVKIADKPVWSMFYITLTSRKAIDITNRYKRKDKRPKLVRDCRYQSQRSWVHGNTCAFRNCQISGPISNRFNFFPWLLHQIAAMSQLLCIRPGLPFPAVFAWNNERATVMCKYVRESLSFERVRKEI